MNRIFMARLVREISELNRVVALWSCRNPGDREKRSKVILAAPRRQEFPKRGDDLADVHSERVVSPVSCYQLQ